MKFSHQYLGYESEEQRDIFSCNILDDFGKSLGHCKYYKTDGCDDVVIIEFINISYVHRRRGYATTMVQELQRRYELKWDHRFSEVGRKWYEGLLKKQVISD